MQQNAYWHIILCIWLFLYLKSYHKKNPEFQDIFFGVATILCVYKEITKNTKENMPSDHFCSHFQQEGRINLIPSPECCIFIAVSGDTHIEVILGHMAIWLYGHMAEIWSYGHIAIWLYGIGGGQYVCFWKQQYKCNNLTKELR